MFPFDNASLRLGVVGTEIDNSPCNITLETTARNIQPCLNTIFSVSIAVLPLMVTDDFNVTLVRFDNKSDYFGNLPHMLDALEMGNIDFVASGYVLTETLMKRKFTFTRPMFTNNYIFIVNSDTLLAAVQDYTLLFRPLRPSVWACSAACLIVFTTTVWLAKGKSTFPVPSWFFVFLIIVYTNNLKALLTAPKYVIPFKGVNQMLRKLEEGNIRLMVPNDDDLTTNPKYEAFRNFPHLYKRFSHALKHNPLIRTSLAAATCNLHAAPGLFTFGYEHYEIATARYWCKDQLRLLEFIPSNLPPGYQVMVFGKTEKGCALSELVSRSIDSVKAVSNVYFTHAKTMRNRQRTLKENKVIYVRFKDIVPAFFFLACGFSVGSLHFVCECYIGRSVRREALV